MRNHTYPKKTPVKFFKTVYDANQSNRNHWKLNTKLALIELKQVECTFCIFGDMISRI